VHQHNLHAGGVDGGPFRFQVGQRLATKRATGMSQEDDKCRTALSQLGQ